MRMLKRFVLAAVIIGSVMWLFRGPIFNGVVQYGIVGVRGEAKPLATLSDTSTDLDAAIEAALDTTAGRLHFSTRSVDNDPVILMQGGPANCIGYAALCASLVQGHLERAGLSDRYQVDAVVAKLYMGDRDLHAFFSDPFWKDHDVVRITDRSSGEVIVLDPTLYDRFGIGRVSIWSAN